jgi:hypothetical protein
MRDGHHLCDWPYEESFADFGMINAGAIEFWLRHNILCDQSAFAADAYVPPRL